VKKRNQTIKIAIFHNLQKGGGLNFAIKTIQQLKKKHNIDLYCFETNISSNLVNKIHLFKLKKTNNIISSMYQIFFELRSKNQKIANKINKKNYDLIIIFPSLLTQAPYILRYLNQKTVTIYIFTETKREFYEKTNYKQTLLNNLYQTIRHPIKQIDLTNCKYAKHIVAISQYSANLLSQIYKQKSHIIYPGLKFTASKSRSIHNKKTILSVGALQKIKGHDFSIEQVSKIKCKFTILGRKSAGSETIIKLTKNKTNVSLIHTEDNRKKEKIYKKQTFFLANQNKEPFGLATLEAINQSCYVFGKNEGGTPEIIKHGVNGFLYPNIIKISNNILRQKINRKKIRTIKSCKIDWKESTKKLLYVYHYLHQKRSRKYQKKLHLVKNLPCYKRNNSYR